MTAKVRKGDVLLWSDGCTTLVLARGWVFEHLNDEMLYTYRGINGMDYAAEVLPDSVQLKGGKLLRFSRRNLKKRRRLRAKKRVR